MKYFAIGSGIWGSVIAERIASQMGEKVTVFEKREHIGGNCHSSLDAETGIECHRYGSHIFHTSIPRVMEYLSDFCVLTNYRHKVLTKHKDRVYCMPINLDTINDFYGKNFSPEEARNFLQAEISRDAIADPANLEEKAISLIGRPLYEAFIKNYTQKQWERDPKTLPPSIITRLPFRTNYDMGYFKDTWQGVPLEGYDKLFQNILSHPNITLKLRTDYLQIKDQLPKDAIIIYTGIPDELFGYRYGELAWRSLKFEWETVDRNDFQGTTVMNYADADVPYTRIHEFKHYHPERKKPYELDKTVICREYPQTFRHGLEAYYPVNDDKNSALYEKYVREAEKVPNLILGGRLGAYRYWDMDKAIDNALGAFDSMAKSKLKNFFQKSFERI